MQCKKCGIELIDAGNEKLCSACKEKRVKTLKTVGIVGAIGLAAIGLGYGVSPVDIIPDIVPVAGAIDDVIVGAFSGLRTIGAIALAIYSGVKQNTIAKDNDQMMK